MIDHHRPPVLPGPGRRQAIVALQPSGIVGGGQRDAALRAGMGIDELSMSGSTIPKVKERITKINLTSAQSLVAKVLQFDKTEEVINYLKKK